MGKSDLKRKESMKKLKNSKKKSEESMKKHKNYKIKVNQWNNQKFVKNGKTRHTQNLRIISKTLKLGYSNLKIGFKAKRTNKNTD